MYAPGVFATMRPASRMAPVMPCTAHSRQETGDVVRRNEGIPTPLGRCSYTHIALTHWACLAFFGTVREQAIDRSRHKTLPYVRATPLCSHTAVTLSMHQHVSGKQPSPHGATCIGSLYNYSLVRALPRACLPSVSTSLAPNAASSTRRSTLMVSGIVRMSLYP